MTNDKLSVYKFSFHANFISLPAVSTKINIWIINNSCNLDINIANLLLQCKLNNILNINFLFTVQLYYNSNIHIIITERHSHKLERVESTLKSRYQGKSMKRHFFILFNLVCWCRYIYVPFYYISYDWK